MTMSIDRKDVRDGDGPRKTGDAPMGGTDEWGNLRVVLGI